MCLVTKFTIVCGLRQIGPISNLIDQSAHTYKKQCWKKIITQSQTHMHRKHKAVKIEKTRQIMWFDKLLIYVVFDLKEITFSLLLNL